MRSVGGVGESKKGDGGVLDGNTHFRKDTGEYLAFFKERLLIKKREEEGLEPGSGFIEGLLKSHVIMNI